MTRLPHDSGERGYVLIAAVASIGVFAAIALTIISATRIDIVKGRGEIANLRGRLAAEAGLAIALHGLINRDAETLALLGGRAQEIEFGGAQVSITLVDERGKISLNNSEPATIERMLIETGIDNAQVQIARDSLMDWVDPDDEPSPNGAEAPYYAEKGIRPRNGTLLSIDELGAIRGFSPDLVERLRPFVTVEPGTVPFSPRYASVQAITAAGGAGSAVAGIERQREVSGQRTAIAFGTETSFVGRPITISVDAATTDRERYHLEAVVEVTGSQAHPYVIRRTS